MRIDRVLLTGAALLFLLGAPVAADEIVWPTYSQVSHSTDAALDCAQLDAELAHVSADIKMLAKARDRVEEAMKTAFDLQRYSAAQRQGSAVFTGGGAGAAAEGYPKAREEIVASERIARARHDFLTNLKSVCKTPPPGGTPPAPQ